MNKYYIYIFCLFFCLPVIAQDSFYKAVKNLDTGYYVTDSTYKRKDVNKSFKVAPKMNWYNVRIHDYKQYEPDVSYDLINVASLKNIEIIYIKSHKPLSGYFYSRVEIQQWTFTNDDEAQKAYKIIEDTYAVMRERLIKAPWSYWQNGNKLYFVFTAGHYMMGIQKDIEKRLKEKL